MYAAADGSFAKAEKRLLKFCGIAVSENTIKTLCDKEAVKIEQWQKTDPLSTQQFQDSYGEWEFTTDGTMVNTLGGWREVRIGIFSLRELGKSALPSEWDTRKLPRPHQSVAFAAMEEKEVFRHRFGSWVNRLKIADRLPTMSVLGDGAHWIWDAALLEFGKTLECLDIYHALKHLSDCGKMLYKAESVEFAAWQSETKRLLLEEGYAGIHDFLERQKVGLPDVTPSKQLEALKGVEGYFGWHRERLDYRERLWEGRAIGSGQVEGACKNLIGSRLKQTGARWRSDRINRMGVICSLFYADQWDDYWKKTA